MNLISKEIRRAEHEYMNIHPPPPRPPINALVTPLTILLVLRITIAQRIYTVYTVDDKSPRIGPMTCRYGD